MGFKKLQNKNRNLKLDYLGWMVTFKNLVRVSGPWVPLLFTAHSHFNGNVLGVCMYSEDSSSILWDGLLYFQTIWTATLHIRPTEIHINKNQKIKHSFSCI